MIKIRLLVLLLISLLQVNCRRDDPGSPLKFKGYQNNPVLVPGSPGSWDDAIVLNAFTLEYDDSIYMFYSAYSQTGKRSLGLATSHDGYHFTKFSGNPVLEGDNTGFDAFGVAQAQVLKTDSGWLLYYNAREIAGFSSGPFIGTATARSLRGPWKRAGNPVLSAGKKGEWDAGFIYLGSILVLEDSNWVMYYSSGEDISSGPGFTIGRAVSKDGIHWTKYNDPATSDRPFADSDPVLMTGNPGDWDAGYVVSNVVKTVPGGFEMYYAGGRDHKSPLELGQEGSIGYAVSNDGIHWKKYPGNPVYRVEDDPCPFIQGNTGAIIQSQTLLFRDTLCFMYYDYGHLVGKIGVATARVH